MTLDTGLKVHLEYGESSTDLNIQLAESGSGEEEQSQEQEHCNATLKNTK